MIQLGHKNDDKRINNAKEMINIPLGCKLDTKKDEKGVQ